MSTRDAKESLGISLSKLDNIDDEKLRERAYRSVNAYVQYIYATATGGAGPIAVPPSPTGSSATTTGTFKCPSCSYSGVATYR